MPEDTKEIWKIIRNYSDYQISDFGRIKSFRRSKKGRILKPYKGSEGYYRIDLFNEFGRKSIKMHILLYEIFNKEIMERDEIVHHINENKLDNNLTNFKKMTKSDHHSLHNKGKIFSKLHRKNLSDSKKGFNNPRGMLGRKHSEYSKYLMKENHINVKGENNQNSKLEEWMVKAIYQISNSPIIKQLKITQQEIADVFNISKETIYRIKNKKSWKHIKTENI